MIPLRSTKEIEVLKRELLSQDYSIAVMRPVFEDLIFDYIFPGNEGISDAGRVAEVIEEIIGTRPGQITRVGIRVVYKDLLVELSDGTKKTFPEFTVYVYLEKVGTGTRIVSIYVPTEITPAATTFRELIAVKYYDRVERLRVVDLVDAEALREMFSKNDLIDEDFVITTVRDL